MAATSAILTAAFCREGGGGDKGIEEAAFKSSVSHRHQICTTGAIALRAGPRASCHVIRNRCNVNTRSECWRTSCSRGSPHTTIHAEGRTRSSCFVDYYGYGCSNGPSDGAGDGVSNANFIRDIECCSQLSGFSHGRWRERMRRRQTGASGVDRFGNSLTSSSVRVPFGAAPPGQHARTNKTRGQLQVVAAAKKTFGSFDEMINESDLPVLVDFYATWCGPCQLMAQILAEVGAEMKGRAKVVKIDSEKYPKLASRYGIQALPTLLVFHKGKLIDRLEGATPKDQLLARMASVLTTNTV